METIMTNLSSSALIVNLSISVWTGRKLDKSVSQEIDSSKGTKARAGNYHKNLFAGSQALEAITKIAGEVRTWHYLMTLPWGDNGDRILSVAVMPEYRAELEAFEQRFIDAVNNFLREYATLVSAAAFSLGALFNRNDYPTVEEIEDKFGFRYSFAPIPEAGDFRVDIPNEGLLELKQSYEAALTNRIDSAMKDAWGRVYEVLMRMSDRLADDDKGKHKIFRDSLIDNAVELCTLLNYLNITKDVKLEDMRRNLEGTLRGVDAEGIRESDSTRHKVKSEVDALLEKFSV